jgi:O-antigen/teichoic acid export membrane protein
MRSVKWSHEASLVAYRAFSDVAGKGAFFLVTVFAARTMSQHGFGIFSLGTTFGWMAAVATDFGIQLHLARAVARRPDTAARLLRGWLKVRLATSAAALAAVAAGLTLIDADAAVRLPVLLLVFVYILSGLIEFLHYFYRGLARSDLESTLTLWQRFAMLLAAGAALTWRPDVVTLALAMLIPVAATLAYSLRRASRMARQLASADAGSERRASFDEPAVRSLVDVAPIGVGIVLSALYFRVDVLLIEIWKGTEAVALYNAVYRLVEALRLFPAAVLAVALPALFRATTTRPLVGVSMIVTGFSLIVAATLWSSAGWLVPLIYGSHYFESVSVFRILLLSLPLMSLNYALTHQLLGWNGQLAYALIAAAALLFNVTLNLRLIPSMSIAGAAWATLATEVLLTIGCILALWMRSARPSPESMTAAVSP